MRLLSILALSLLPSMSIAQTVGVRGGEHETFTRIVLDLPGPVRWRLEKGDALMLRLDGLKAQFDLSKVMQKLSAGRVLGLRQVAGSLEIRMGCACELNSFLAGERMLVIDISGTTEPMANSPKMRPKLRPARSIETADKSEFKLPLVGFGANKNDQKMRPVVGVDLSGMPEPDVSEARRRMLQSLARAASQGLIAPRAKMTGTAEKTPDKEMATVRQGADRLSIENVRTFSSLDRDFFAVQGTLKGQENIVLCVKDDEFNLSPFHEDGDFARAISSRRAELFGEFDRANDEAVEALVRAYLSFGFGFEATQILNETEKSGHYPHLEAIAELIENGRLTGERPDGWRLDCDGKVAMWSVLASTENVTDFGVNGEAVFRSFSALPVPLRQQIAPDLAKKLVSADQKELAKEILRVAERGTSYPSSGVAIAKASVENSPSKEEVVTALEKAVASNSGTAPEALIRLLDLFVEEERVIDAQFQELADSFAFEYRGEALGPDLERVALLAQVSSGIFNSPFQRLLSIAPSLDQDKVNSASSYVLDRYTENADDALFAASLHVPDLTKFTFDTASAHSAAKRLMKLGFNERALVLLSSAKPGEAGRERRILRAQAALSLNFPRQAEAELLGLTGSDIEALRAEARTQSGDFRGARIALEELGDNQGASEQAFLGLEWDALGRLGGKSWQPEMELALQNSSLREQDGSLQRSHEILSSSEELRETLSSVLSKHDAPDGIAR